MQYLGSIAGLLLSFALGGAAFAQDTPSSDGPPVEARLRTGGFGGMPVISSKGLSSTAARTGTSNLGSPPENSWIGANNGKGSVPGHSLGLAGSNGGFGIGSGGGRGGGNSVGAPGPVAGAGLPFLLLAGGYALYRKRRAARSV